MMIFFKTAITGIGATLVMDLWSLLQKYLLKVPPLNYALVGAGFYGCPEESTGIIRLPQRREYKGRCSPAGCFTT